MVDVECLAFGCRLAITMWSGHHGDVTWGIYAFNSEWRIYASLNWIIIGSDNGLSPVRRRAIIWTNAGILLIGTLERNFTEILIGIQTFSFKKLHLKTSSGKWRPFCLGLNVLNHRQPECLFRVYLADTRESITVSQYWYFVRGVRGFLAKRTNTDNCSQIMRLYVQYNFAPKLVELPVILEPQDAHMKSV